MPIALDDSYTLFKRCAPQVAPETVAAIVKTESGGNPMAININYRNVRLARRASSLTEAIGWTKWLIQNGYNVDMGLMQVNSQHLPRLGLTVERIFDPCTNIQIGSMILTQNYLKAKGQYGHGQNALFASLSAYNTGNFRRGFNNGYVSRVVKNAGKPVVIPMMNEAINQPPLLSSGLTMKPFTPPSYNFSSSSNQQKTVHVKRSKYHSKYAKTQINNTVAQPDAESPYDAPTGIQMN